MKTDYILKLNTKYEIMTPNGYKSFGGIRKLIKSDYYEIHLSNGYKLKCSINHKFIKDGVEIVINDINVGDYIDGDDNKKVVIQIKEYKTKDITLFDIVEVDGGNIFNVDGVVSHNCDFVGSGDTVLDPELLTWYKNTYVMEPVEKAGFDRNLWKWEYPNYNKQYMVVADVARGDGADYSTAQVLDIEDCSQVAEYRGMIDTKDFGNFLTALATEYNNALLVIENSNVGWACIQQVIDRGYQNLFYMSNDLKYIDVERQMSNRFYRDERQMVAGFSTTTKTRPLIISALDTYMNEKDILIRSGRLIDEMFTFIWQSGRAEAMKGYNDDLIMALAIGLWVRNTALRLRQEGIDLTKNMLNSAHVAKYSGMITTGHLNSNPYEMEVGNKEIENLTWLLR
jgi:hypothetical protein